MMMPSSDRVLAMVRGHPAGVTIPMLMAEYDPDLPTIDREMLRRKLYVRLRNLEKYGLVTRATTAARIQGGHTTTWRAVRC